MSSLSFLTDLAIKQVVKYSDQIVEPVTVSYDDNAWLAVSIISGELSKSIDNLVVMKNDSILGIVGAKEILSNLVENSPNFTNIKVKFIMENNPLVVSEEVRFSELLKEMVKRKRIFAVITNNERFACFPVKALLEICSLLPFEEKIHNLPTKKIITFTESANVHDIINTMIKNKTRRLFFENTTFYIDDRNIIHKIAQGRNFQDYDKFLNLRVSESDFQNAKIIHEDLKLQDLCKIMLNESRVIIKDNSIFTPWDVLSFLEEKLE